MTDTPSSFAATHYAPRAQDYLGSEVHRQGPDLDQLEQLLDGYAHARLLDLGCGGGHVSYRASPRVASVVACDVTPSMLDTVMRTAADRHLANIAVEQATAERMPFADDSFDVLVTRYSTHHWQDRDAGLREARRVLKPGGLAVFIDVVSPEPALLDSWLQTLELLRDVSHVRNYRASEWTAALGAAGFNIAGCTARRLPLRFADWVARTRTPAEQVAAIRALQEAAPREVREHFLMQADGSFTLDTATYVAN